MKKETKTLLWGILWLVLFALWTMLVQTVDVGPVGETGTDIGFRTVNTLFHHRTGVHMALYTLTDWLGLVPVAVCLGFGGLGFRQLVRRRSLFRVDSDLLLLGLYYIAVMVGYLIFELFPINYRPVLIDGRLEASYPSSTTLLVLCVMPTLVFQGKRRWKKTWVVQITGIFVGAFSLLMVAGRTVSGVHWITDIVGSLLLSAGLFRISKALVFLLLKKEA